METNKIKNYAGILTLMLEITPSITIPESELVFSFTRAGGPGGQNVNKVSTAVHLHFDVLASPSLPEDIKNAPDRDCRQAHARGRRADHQGLSKTQPGCQPSGSRKSPDRLDPQGSPKAQKHATKPVPAVPLRKNV